MHSLSIAALLILLAQPEAVAEPGFQMSFCATAALVALAEAWPIRFAGDRPVRPSGRFSVVLQRGARLDVLVPR